MKVYFLGRIFNRGRNDPCLCQSGKKFKKCCLPEIMSVDNPNQDMMTIPILHARRWRSRMMKWSKK